MSDDKKYYQRVSESKLSRVWKAIETEVVLKRAYLNPDFKAQDIAAKHDFSIKDISAALQMRQGCNFATYIQSLRVKAVCEMFAQPGLDEISCEKIGLQNGFNSRQSLHNAFIKHTGMTPQAYRTLHYYKNNEN